MIQPRAILAHDFGVATQAYSERDAILYALGVGMGRNPLDPAELRFLDERRLAVLSSFAATLCTPGLWLSAPHFGVDLTRLVHLAQSAEFPHALPPAAKVQGRAKVVALHDRGPERGAMLVVEREIADVEQQRAYCRLRQTLLLRGDGGFGGSPPPREARWEPAGAPITVEQWKTSERAALLYRLSGDWNRLHLDPEVAQAAGFGRPILHGLASWAMAGVAASLALGFDPAAVESLACRFSGVVLPGDTVEFRLWHDDEERTVRFQGLVGDKLVLDNGLVTWRSA